LPYASAYKQDEQEIKRLLVEAGLETSGNFNEPADHRAIYRELRSNMDFSWGRGRGRGGKRERVRKKTRTGRGARLKEVGGSGSIEARLVFVSYS
ncbi:molecular chaperone TorD family protein, partial [Escherichia coli]|uniref:molecular chaperone TorD family protein n=1 Tax=Escherichia coli TaxID=562 RepID=UPI0014857F04